MDYRKITDGLVRKAMKLCGGGALKVGPGQITDDSEMAMCLLGAAYEDT